MSDYNSVATALSNGASPEMLCSTCPWDRHCMTPPAMSKQEVEAKLEEAKAQDEKQRREAEVRGKEPGLPMGMLITAIAVGGRDTQATLCPVFSMRLKSSQGQRIATGTKALMQSWDDNA